MQVLRIIAIAVIASISTAIPVNNQHLTARDIGPYQDCTSGDMCADGPFLEAYACCEVPGGNGRTACIRATDCPQNEASRMQSTWQKIGWLRLAITDWKTCQPNGVDTCTNPNFVCCIAPEDASSGKYTCRSNDQCSVNNNSGPTNSNTQGKTITDWQTCQQGRDSCLNNNYVCCVAPADLGSNKATCRPQNDCGNNGGNNGNNNSGNNGSNNVGNKIADWQTCQFGRDSCLNNNYVCCVAQADLGIGKATCRPKDQCGNTNGGNSNNGNNNGGSGKLIPMWENCGLTDTCANGFVCCAAKADLVGGKTTCRPTNDCGNSSWLAQCTKDDWMCGTDRKTLYQCTPSKSNMWIWAPKKECDTGLSCYDDGKVVGCR